MDIEVFRDLVICIFGLGATVAVVIFVVLALILFFRVKPILDNLRATSDRVNRLSRSVEEEIGRPLAQCAALFQGVRQAFDMFGFLRRKKEDR